MNPILRLALFFAVGVALGVSFEMYRRMKREE